VYAHGATDAAAPARLKAARRRLRQSPPAHRFTPRGDRAFAGWVALGDTTANGLPDALDVAPVVLVAVRVEAPPTPRVDHAHHAVRLPRLGVVADRLDALRQTDPLVGSTSAAGAGGVVVARLGRLPRLFRRLGKHCGEVRADALARLARLRREHVEVCVRGPRLRLRLWRCAWLDVPASSVVPVGGSPELARAVWRLERDEVAGRETDHRSAHLLDAVGAHEPHPLTDARNPWLALVLGVFEDFEEAMTKNDPYQSGFGTYFSNDEASIILGEWHRGRDQEREAAIETLRSMLMEHACGLAEGARELRRDGEDTDHLEPRACIAIALALLL